MAFASRWGLADKEPDVPEGEDSLRHARRFRGKMAKSVIDASEIDELIDEATEAGYVTVDDLLAVFPRGETRLDELEDLIAELEERGIAVQENAVEADEEEHDRVPAGARGPERRSQERDRLSQIPTTDTTALYFHEMGQVPLLTRKEEGTLARQWQKARQAEARLARNGHDARERARLRRQIEAGHAARDHLIMANTRLVVSIAKKYQGQGIPFQDLIQEGNLGLMKAVDKFDPDLGYKFSTYATWWIRQGITRSIANQGRTIRLPVHMRDSMRKLRRTMHRLEQEQGRTPSLEEVAEEMGLTPEKVRWMMRVTRRPLSLERPVGEEEDSELGYFIENEKAPAPSETTEQALLRASLEEAMSTLTPREARILRMRFGLQDGVDHTLEEVGNRFGITRERIRQIEQKALQRLRHPYRSRRLRDFMS
jgi:RNA polymerase primary sigma factor